jgi:GT2 family glycosyltransferase
VPHSPRSARVQVSFIIPLFNNLALTRACVESLQATLPAGLTYEIVLVDDGSTDGTRAWLATLTAPFRVVLNERNLGYAGANNRAIAVARGDFLALLNNDLILLPRWFEPMLAAHRSLRGRAGLIGNIQVEVRTGLIDHVGIVINAQGKPVHDRKRPCRIESFFAPVRPVPALTGACVLVERALWQQLGGFDEAYVNGGEDVDLCFRARALGRINAVALRSMVRHHVSASIGRKARDEENSYRLARRWHRDFVLAADGPMREWCRERFDQILLEPRYPDRDLACRTWLYANHFTRKPLPEALAFIESELAKEFAHWETLFPAVKN